MKKILAIALLAFPLFASAQTAYTVNYSANFLVGSGPTYFDRLPASDMLIEGSFSWIVSTNPEQYVNSSGVGQYPLLQQSVSLNGTTALVRAGGVTGPTASPLQVGSDTQTFAFLDANNFIEPDLQLVTVGVFFSGTNGNSTPTSAADFGPLSGMSMLVNYRTAGPAVSQYGWATQISSFAFSSRDITPVTAVPEPETYALMLVGLGLMGTMARRRKAKQTA